MLWTGLIAAALLATGSPPVQGQGNPAPPAANGRDRGQEVVCRNYAVTGSRFTHRRCRTREQAQIAAEEAQRFMRDGRRSSPSVEEYVNPLTTPATPAGPLT